MTADYTWLALDVAALVLIVFMIWGAARRGMLRTLVNFVGGIVAAVAAGFLSTPFAQFLYNTVVRDAIRMVISRQVSEALQSGLSDGSSWLAVIPAWLGGMLPAGTTVETPQTVADVVPVVEQLIDAALAQPILTLLRGVCFFVLFSVLLALVHYVARLLSLVDRIPVVGSVNTMMGGVLGAGQALVVLYLLAVVAQIYIAATGGGGEYVSDQVFSDSFLFGFFYRL